MADEESIPFGLSLLRQPLKEPTLDARSTSASRLTLREPKLDARGVRDSRPSSVDRALAQNLTPAATQAKPESRSVRATGNQGPSEFLKELESLRIKAIFNGIRPANVKHSDLVDNDRIFRHQRVVSLLENSAKEFGINPGLLGEHLVAETNFGAFVSGAKGSGAGTDFGSRLIDSTELGLDHFVIEHAQIVARLPNAAAIKYMLSEKPYISEANQPFFNKKYGPLEKLKLSDLSPERQLEFVDDVIKYNKPRVRFTLAEGVRASAAYIKYKETFARGTRTGIGNQEFERLPPEIRFQLTRLLVNPGTEKAHLGTHHWIEQTKLGHYENLFDFSDRSLHDTNKNRAKDIPRRATIHTARALHISNEFFPESEL